MHAQLVDEQIAKFKQDFNREVLLPLRSDFRVLGLKAYEIWKRDLLVSLNNRCLTKSIASDY
jgi:hypothetical protein